MLGNQNIKNLAPSIDLSFKNVNPNEENND